MSIISRIRGEVEAVRWAHENGGVWALKSHFFSLTQFLAWVELTMGYGSVTHPAGSTLESEIAWTQKRLKERLADPRVKLPRFEDGQLVLIGSLALSGDLVAEVTEISMSKEGFMLRGKTQDERGLDTCFVYTWSDGVKRPDPHPTGMDGKPIEVGEFVWAKAHWKDEWIKYRVLEILPDGKCRLLDVEVPASVPTLEPEKLTHSEPDTWEKLESDAGEGPFSYCEKVGHHLDTFESSEEFKSKDLLRRARELAKRERGER